MTSAERPAQYPENLKIIRKRSLVSTNLFLKKNLETYTDMAPVMVCSSGQTGGKGRGTNRWFSPKNSGIYCSFLFKFATDIEIGLLSIATGIAIVESISEIAGIRCDLKWPNDIEFKGKKLGGILTENSFFSNKIVSVVGIGINVNIARESFPSDLSFKATSLSAVTGNAIDINRLNISIASGLINQTSIISKGRRKEIIEKYKKYIKHKSGEYMTLNYSGKKITGTFSEIDDSGGIILNTGEDKLTIIYSGEISDPSKISI